MSKSHFTIEAHFGHTTKRKGFLTIDRASNTISVREARGRDTFVMPLDEVADIIALKMLAVKGNEERTTRPRRRVVMARRGLLSIGR